MSKDVGMRATENTKTALLMAESWRGVKMGQTSKHTCSLKNKRLARRLRNRKLQKKITTRGGR